MPRPDLVHYATEGQYRAHFESVYCCGPIMTFDGIPVRFRKKNFDHCMQMTQRGKSKTKIGWDQNRLERIDWIKATLEHSQADLFFGWDRDKKCVAFDRRVSVVFGDYIVVLAMKNDGQGNYSADFITAYEADSRTIAQVRAKPRWQK